MKYTKILCTKFGGPQVLTLVEEDLPSPQPGQVRIRLLAAGVSWADSMMRRGIYPGQPRPPFTPGYDIVGVVDELGPGVTLLQKNQTVAALTVHGGYAEYIFLPESEPVPFPPNLDPSAAVCLVLNYVTAYQMLHRQTTLHPGDWILVHSAAGGVGTALLQLARLDNLKTIGTASKSKHDLLTSLGCIPIDYHSTKFEIETRRLVPTGVTAAFDSIGGPHWFRSRRTLKPAGSLIAFGSQGASTLSAISCAIPLYLYPGRHFSFYNITKLKKKHPAQFRQDLSALFNLLATNQINPIIAAKLPLQQAPQAHHLLETNSTRGKLVLTF